MSGDRDPGMLIISGKLNENVSFEAVENEVWGIINQVKTECVSDFELTKVKNKFETAHIYGEMSVMNKAMILGYAELIGDVNGINTELSEYEAVQVEDIKEWAGQFLTEESVCRLHVKKENNE